MQIAPKEKFCKLAAIKFMKILFRIQFSFQVFLLCLKTQKKKSSRQFFLLWNGKIKCTTTFQCHGQASKLCSPSIKRYSMYLTYVCNLYNVHLSIHWISTMTNEYIEQHQRSLTLRQIFYSWPDRHYSTFNTKSA